MRLNELYDYHPYRLSMKQRRFIQRWEKKRLTPRWKFILLNGVLREGLFFFILIKIIQALYDINSFTTLYTSIGGLLFLLFETGFWLGGGFVIGWFKFNSYETEYEMLKSMEHY
jgi:hypothetical protein